LIEELSVLGRGIVLGLAIAAPIGPIGLLCIRRTVERGVVVGVATGLGSAFVDGLFGAIAAFGVSQVIDALMGHVKELRLLGGLFLLGAALHGFLRDPEPMAEEPPARDLAGAVASGVLLTVTNPVTIMGIIAVVVGFGGRLDHQGAATLTVGIFLGSLLWWAILCGGISAVRHKFTPRTVHWINRGTAAVLAAIGAWALVSAFGPWTA